MAAKKTSTRPQRKPGKATSGKFDPRLKAAIADILGGNAKEITIEFDRKLSPGGARLSAGDGSWDGNVYKYRY